MENSHKKVDKAWKLVKKGQVKKVGRCIYEIGDHTTIAGDEKVSCTCTDFLINSIKKQKNVVQIKSVCKHIIAALQFEALLRWDSNNTTHQKKSKEEKSATKNSEKQVSPRIALTDTETGQTIKSK